MTPPPAKLVPAVATESNALPVPFEQEASALDVPTGEDHADFPVRHPLAFLQ